MTIAEREEVAAVIVASVCGVYFAWWQVVEMAGIARRQPCRNPRCPKVFTTDSLVEKYCCPSCRDEARRIRERLRYRKRQHEN